LLDGKSFQGKKQKGQTYTFHKSEWRGAPIKFKSALDSCELSERSGKYKMNGFVGVTDNDSFAFLSQQPGIDEVNFLKGDVRKKVNNESMTVRATFLTTLAGQVSQG